MSTIINKKFSTTFLMILISCTTIHTQGIISVKLFKDPTCYTFLDNLPPGVIFNGSDPCALFLDESIGTNHIFEKSEFSTDHQDEFDFSFKEARIISVGTFKGNKRLIILPGDRLDIEIDDLNNIFEIRGKSAPAQNLYNNLDLNWVRKDGFEFWLSVELSSALQLLSDAIDTRMKPFSDFVEDGIIPVEFYEIVEKDITYKLAYQLATSLKVKLDKSPAEEEVILSLMETLFSSYPIFNKDDIMPSFLLKHYIEDYLWYTQRKKGRGFSAKGKSSQEIVEELSELKAVTTKESYEFHAIFLLKRYLYRLNDGVIPPYLQYKQSYPNSNYPKRVFDLDHKYEGMTALSIQELDSSFVFLEHGKINSLQDLSKRLSKEVIYIDMWASWCGPCLYLFRYKEQLEEVLRKNGVTLLYLTIDKEKLKQSWLSRVKEYRIKGIHLMANENLIKDIRNKTTWDNTVPWFILLDSNGNIINENAASAAELDLLKRQIQLKNR